MRIGRNQSRSYVCLGWTVAFIATVHLAWVGLRSRRRDGIYVLFLGVRVPEIDVPRCTLVEGEDTRIHEHSQTGNEIGHMRNQVAPPLPPVPSAQGMAAEQRTSGLPSISTKNMPAPSLTTALRSTLPSAYKRPGIVIPGARKPEPAVGGRATVPVRSLGPHARNGIVLSIFLLLIGTVLVSFVPLNTGQGTFNLFTRASSWVQSQQLDWSVQAQLAATATAGVPQTTTYAPVAMTLPKSQYVAMAEQDASAAGISPLYFTRQINLESGFNPAAHSPSGAEGIAQFMPATAAGLGINPWDPVAALQAAAHLMASYAKEFGGDYAKALAAYNSGSGTVNAAASSCGANWISCLPGQTQHYIAVIMGT